MVGLEPKHTAVRSPESNGMAESFVKTMKRDYISIMPKPDGLTAVKNLAEAFEHYNEWHPHSALGYRSPREYLRRRTSNGLSDKRVWKYRGQSKIEYDFKRRNCFGYLQLASYDSGQHAGKKHNQRSGRDYAIVRFTVDSRGPDGA